MNDNGSKPAPVKQVDDFLRPSGAHKPNGGIDPKAAEALVLGTTDEVLELKLQQELDSCFAQKARAQELQAQVTEEFCALPAEKVFAKTTFYKLFNRKNSREFIIDGVVLEGRIGLDSSLYEKVKSRSVSTFCVGDSIVRFYKACGNTN